MDGRITEYAPAGNPKQDVEGCRPDPEGIKDAPPPNPSGIKVWSFGKRARPKCQKQGVANS
jgi:hypothetical protein